MILGKATTELEQQKAAFTATEIVQQPQMWQETLQQIAARQDEIRSFIKRVTAQDDYIIILTGAGSSEFVGSAASVVLNSSLDLHVHSYGTTDIAACPHYYLSRERPTLLVSCARSGNSPESVGAVQAADAICGNLHHLFITCNEEGELARSAASRNNALSLVLPAETNDRSFVMTSSFSSMYLAVLLAFMSQEPFATAQGQLNTVCSAAEQLTDDYARCEQLVADYDFDRIVYLGSGPLKGIARESALKMLELTRGQVAAVHDSPLGFRHGPKSFLSPRTLTVFYMSPEASTWRYELDLIREMSGQRQGNRILALTNRYDGELQSLVDELLVLDAASLGADLLALDYVAAAQLLALSKSLSLGITPDNPFPSGEVNRVVRGVTIYPVEA